MSDGCLASAHTSRITAVRIWIIVFSTMSRAIFNFLHSSTQKPVEITPAINILAGSICDWSLDVVPPKMRITTPVRMAKPEKAAKTMHLLMIAFKGDPPFSGKGKKSWDWYRLSNTGSTLVLDRGTIFCFYQEQLNNILAIKDHPKWVIGIKRPPPFSGRGSSSALKAYYLD